MQVSGLLAWVLPFAGFPMQVLHEGIAAPSLSSLLCGAPASTAIFFSIYAIGVRERSERDTLRCNAIEISVNSFIYLFI